MTASVLAGVNMKPIPAPARMTGHTWLEKSSWVSRLAQKAETHGGQRTADDHRTLGPSPIEDAPTDLRHHHKPEEEIEQVEAGLLGGLAQGDLGILAGKEKQRDEHQHADPEHQVLDGEGSDPEDPHLHQR